MQDSGKYYRRGDFIGKLGVERSYEKQLRGEKGMRIMLRDVHGRTQGHYQDGKYDKKAIPGKNLTLGLDRDLQALAERLLDRQTRRHRRHRTEDRRNSLHGFIAYLRSAYHGGTRPWQEPHLRLSRDPMKPLLNRAMMGTYPPGSTFKITRALVGLQEGAIDPKFPSLCHHGFNYKGLHVGCHGHAVAHQPGACHRYFVQLLFLLESLPHV